MDFFSAKQKADEYIHDKYRDEVIIVSINVKTYGWIFSFQSKEFLQTGHFLEYTSSAPHRPLELTTIDIDSSSIWFIYKISNCNSNTIRWSWLDNWGNLWETSFHPHNAPSNRIDGWKSNRRKRTRFRH